MNYLEGFHISELLLQLLTIHSAARSDETLLKWLIEHGADPNAELRGRGCWPRTILSTAAYYFSSSAVSYLLEHGARPDSSAVQMVIRRQSLEWQRKNIMLGKCTGSRYAPPLTEQERITMVTTLLNHGADINAVEEGLGYRFLNVAIVPKGAPPLRMAIEYDDLQLVRLLLNRGADLEQVDHLGKTTLQAAGQLRTRNKQALKRALMGQ
jgi:ankyrin repeat protein